MLGLRTTAGVDLAAFEAMHGLSFQEAYGDSARKSLEQALAVYTPDGFFRLTRRGMDVMNTVLLDFL
jgi:coproporphyrinogen III oxidase-like Fe-S oxidoreductase